ncbi:MAG TPA: hypothetical protein VIH17_12425 [Candidatus Acidoferrales bacterium]
MPSPKELEEAIHLFLSLGGMLTVEENDETVLAGSDLRGELNLRGNRLLLHLWSEQGTLVRRVLSIKKQSVDELTLQVERFGRSQPGTLALWRGDRRRGTRAVGRVAFRALFRRVLGQAFPDEQVESLRSSSDRERSFSALYVRGTMGRRRERWAIMGAGGGETQATLDGILTYGLIWLDWSRRSRSSRHQKTLTAGLPRFYQGLRLFLPAGRSRMTANRLAWLDSGPGGTRFELYEVEEDQWRVERVDERDFGNVETHLVGAGRAEEMLRHLPEEARSICALAPDLIEARVTGEAEVLSFRIRGLEFARLAGGRVLFGCDVPAPSTPLRASAAGAGLRQLHEGNRPMLERLVREIAERRTPDAEDRTHPFYRLQAERWLEQLVAGDITRIDPQLDRRFVYSQVPAFAASDRGVIDILTVTRDGRLAVVELKADEDIHLPLQALDYWLRVRWHHEREDFARLGYFPGVALRPGSPQLYLVAPGLRFHPTGDVIRRYLSPEIEVIRVGLNENWRAGLEVVFRQ